MCWLYLLAGLPGEDAMTKVILIRHGETAWNAAKRYLGHSNITLNEDGFRQAELLAERLSRETVDAVYSSDLMRSLETAQLIAQKHKLPVNRDAGLREINFGEWEGLTYSAIMEGWPQLLSSIYTSPGDISIPGGESFSSLRVRATTVLRRYIHNHPEETVAVVTHGGTIRVLLCDIMGMDICNMWTLCQDHTAVNVAEYHSGKWAVSLLNDTKHLTAK